MKTRKWARYKFKGVQPFPLGDNACIHDGDIFRTDTFVGEREVVVVVHKQRHEKDGKSLLSIRENYHLVHAETLAKIIEQSNPIPEPYIRANQYLRYD